MYVTWYQVIHTNTKLMTFDELFSFEHLRASYKSCRKNINWKTSTINYVNKATEMISKTLDELQNNKFKSSGLDKFIRTERGKSRSIQAVKLRERVVQKCLCDYYLVPLLSKKLIYDNGATLKGKGLQFALDRTKALLHKFYNKYKTGGYILLLDFKHYFDSINHTKLFNMVEPLIEDKRIFNLYKYFIKQFGDRGLGLGSQVSQISALFYLNRLDHYIKEQLRQKYYQRYMDDEFIAATTKEELYKIKDKIQELVSAFDLTLHPKKTIIRKTDNFVFLNRHWALTESGKVIVTPVRKGLVRLRTRYNKIKNKGDKIMNQFKASVNGLSKQFKGKRVERYVFNERKTNFN